MVKIVKQQRCDLGLALLLLAWSTLLTSGGAGGGGAGVLADSSANVVRAAAEREERLLSQQDLQGLSYQGVHRMLRDENEPASFRGELRYQQQRRLKREAALNAPANKLNLTHRDLRTFNSSGGQWKGDFQVITAMDLSSNRLVNLSLDHFTQIKQLDVSNNCLQQLPLSLTDNNSQSLPLVTLDLSCNNFSHLSSSFFAQRLPRLKNLNLAGNHLANISRESFYNLLELQTLILSHNNISDIDYETFLALPNLQHLDLSHNHLSGSAIRALQGIPDLVSLSIAYNPQVGAAMQEFVASWSLKELDASGTGLCQVPAALAQSVRTLKLSDNWLRAINCGDMDSYPLLQYLDLSHSRIAHVEDDALGRLELLESLFLDHNLLMRVPSSLPPSLEHLFLQHNQIMELPPSAFAGLVNLQTLDLSGNRLIFLPALVLPRLLTLNLQSAGVESVSQSIVHTLPQLRDLLLENNPIRCSDLLAIAEWASPCRADVGQSVSQKDLKAEYLQFHDFYENFSRGNECWRSEGSAKNETEPPPSCKSSSGPTSATSTPKSLPKVNKSKTKIAEAAATGEPVMGHKKVQVAARTAATTATEIAAAAANQSAGNNTTATTKTLRTTATTLLKQLQQHEAGTTTPKARSQPKSTTAAPILAAEAATATTARNAIQTEQLTLPTNISGAAGTTAAPATAIEVPQTIFEAGKKSDKMPTIETATATAETLLKRPTAADVAETAPQHKHATLQLHVKDRHLIGTPLLMHKGDVLLVDAEQLLLPGTATVADTNADVLDRSQQSPKEKEQKHEPEKPQLATDKRQAEAINGDTKSLEKSHKKKPASLSIKKMTYSTKHAAKMVTDATATAKMQQQPHQHSSVNTPRESTKNSDSELSTFAQLKAYVELKTESKPEHLMDQRQENLHHISGSHPGVMLLVACILVVVLLAGLAHVYRGNRSGPVRPHHQRHHLNDSDDGHSFLHYQGSVSSNSADPARLQKWHHSTRREAPYSSPLHNLQARELQQQQRCQQFYSASLAGSTSSSSAGSGSGSSSRSSLHSPSREDSYYIEMAPSSSPSGGVSSLPMELLGNRGSSSSHSGGFRSKAERMAATDLGGTIGGSSRASQAPPSGIRSVSSRLMGPSSRRLNIW